MADKAVELRVAQNSPENRHQQRKNECRDSQPHGCAVQKGVVVFPQRDNRGYQPKKCHRRQHVSGGSDSDISKPVASLGSGGVLGSHSGDIRA